MLDVLEFSSEELHLRFAETMPQLPQAAVQVPTMLRLRLLLDLTLHADALRWS